MQIDVKIKAVADYSWIVYTEYSQEVESDVVGAELCSDLSKIHQLAVYDETGSKLKDGTHPFTINTDTGFVTGDHSLSTTWVGSTLELEVTVELPDNKCLDTRWKVSLDPVPDCDTTQITPSSLQDQIYYLTDTEVTVSFAPFSAALPTCE